MDNLHDKYVKEKLLNKQNAIDFLKVALPDNLLAQLNLETLISTQSTFVSEHNREIFSDIIFECKRIDGEEVYCNILIEHKSYKDTKVAFQIGRYLMAAYNQQIKNGDNFKPIIPILFYHHQSQWDFQNMETFFTNVPDDFMRYIPKFEIIFFDVKNLSDDVIINIRNIAILTMLLTQKHIKNIEDLLDKLSNIYEALQTQEERNNFKQNIVYIIKIADKRQNIIEILNKKIDKPINKVVMSLYEEITLKGVEVGRMEEKLAVVLELHSDGFNLSQISKYTKLSEKEIIGFLQNQDKIK